MKLIPALDPGSLVVVALTFVLFAVALVVKGIGHDLLLEAGVFLVSVKLILQQVKSATVAADTAARLEELRAAMARVERQLASRPTEEAPLT
jgi:hypothetical protein